jgi:hypothetical protein
VLDERRSGSRLKAVSWETQDGLSVPDGWHDTQLDLDCVMTPLGRGSPVCIPRDARETNEVYFLDEACSQPVLFGTSTPATHVYTWGTAPCQMPTVYRVGAGGSADKTFSRSRDGTCRATGVVGAHLALQDVTGDFVQMSIRRGEPAAGLAAVWLEGDDTLQAHAGFWDTTRDAPCEFPKVYWDYGRASDGSLRCLPQQGGSEQTIWEDPMCSTRLSGAVRRSCPGEPAAMWYSRWDLLVSNCPVSMRILGPGPTFESGFVSDNGSCRPVSSMDDLHHWVTIPPGELPPGMVTAASGEARLQMRWLQTSVGRVTSEIWDRELGALCRPQPVADGSIRCVPRALVAPDYDFADAACTQPLVVIPPGQNPVSTVPPEQLLCGEVKYAAIRSNGGPENIRVYHLGAPYDGRLFSGPDNCHPVGVEGKLVAWRVGAEIPSSDMVEFKRVMR